MESQGKVTVRRIDGSAGEGHSEGNGQREQGKVLVRGMAAVLPVEQTFLL